MRGRWSHEEGCCVKWNAEMKRKKREEGKKTKKEWLSFVVAEHSVTMNLIRGQ